MLNTEEYQNESTRDSLFNTHNTGIESFFDDNNVNNLLWKKNKKDLHTLFFINKFVNSKDNHKLSLKVFYKHQLDKQVKKACRKRFNRVIS